jgi:hypothetical protein
MTRSKRMPSPKAYSRRFILQAISRVGCPLPRLSPVLRRRATKVQGRKLVVVTGGGGGDAYPLMDAYLGMLEQTGGRRQDRQRSDCRTLHAQVATQAPGASGPAPGGDGTPLFPPYGRDAGRGRSGGGMAGYNTLCELLSQKTLSLLIPRETPRKEQLIRSQIFKQQGLADYISGPRYRPGPCRTKCFTCWKMPGTSARPSTTSP